MATIVVEDGGTYSSLNDALNVANQDDIISIEGTWTGADTDNCTIADSGITIQTDVDSMHPGYPYQGSGNWYRLRPTSGHVFTVNSYGLTIDGVDFQNASTTASDECFRVAITGSGSITVKNSPFGFASRNSEQDGFYLNNSGTCTVTLENCPIYNVYRGVFDVWAGNTNININSCSFYDIGYSATASSRSGVVGDNTADTVVVNFFNSFAHINTGSPFSNSGNGTSTVTIDRGITNVADWTTTGWDTENITDSLLDHNFTDDDTKSSDGDWVIVEDITTSPYDLRLATNAYNEAQDAHADGSGANLTMPSLDIVGTSRPQNTDYDIGSFEIVAAGVIDNDKLSLITYQQMWNTPIPVSPDGLGQGDKQHLIAQYAGIDWGAPPGGRISRYQDLSGLRGQGQMTWNPME